TWADHVSFFYSHPYSAWYALEHYKDTEIRYIVGSIYLTRYDEIGIHILTDFQGKGYGKTAIELLMEHHPRSRYLANIAPGNERSFRFFDKLGFQTLQVTKEFKKSV